MYVNRIFIFTKKKMSNDNDYEPDYTPRQIVAQAANVTYEENLLQLYQEYQQNPNCAKSLVFFPIGLSHSPAYLKLKGRVESNVIFNETYGTYSFAFQLTDHLDTKALDIDLRPIVYNRYPALNQFQFKSPVKQGQLWIKIKQQGGQYSFNNIPWESHHKKIKGFPIIPGQQLTLTTKFGGYVNFASQYKGLFLTLLDIDVPGYPRPRPCDPLPPCPSPNPQCPNPTPHCPSPEPHCPRPRPRPRPRPTPQGTDPC